MYNGIDPEKRLKKMVDGPDKIVSKTNFYKKQGALNNKVVFKDWDKVNYRTATFNEIGNISMARKVMNPMNDLKISETAYLKDEWVMRPPQIKRNTIL